MASRYEFPAKEKDGLNMISVHPIAQSKIEVHATEKSKNKHKLTLLWHCGLGHPHLAAMLSGHSKLVVNIYAQGVPK